MTQRVRSAPRKTARAPGRRAPTAVAGERLAGVERPHEAHNARVQRTRARDTHTDSRRYVSSQLVASRWTSCACMGLCVLGLSCELKQY